jgi:hypothetical protein
VNASSPSVWRLRSDLAWARALLWFAGAGRAGEPKRDVHLFLADRYGRLAERYAEAGATKKANRLKRKFDFHHRAAEEALLREERASAEN